MISIPPLFPSRIRYNKFSRAQSKNRIAERIKSILTLVTENANRKSAAGSGANRMLSLRTRPRQQETYCSFLNGRIAVNPTRGRLAKFHVAKDRVHFRPTSAYRNYHPSWNAIAPRNLRTRSNTKSEKFHCDNTRARKKLLNRRYCAILYRLKMILHCVTT